MNWFANNSHTLITASVSVFVTSAAWALEAFVQQRRLERIMERIYRAG